MNGKAAKRIALAAYITGTPLKVLKRGYIEKPYHQRRIPGVKVASHKQAIIRLKCIRGTPPWEK